MWWLPVLWLLALGSGCGENIPDPRVGSWKVIAVGNRRISGGSVWTFNRDGTCYVSRQQGTYAEANGVLNITLPHLNYQMKPVVSNDGKQLILTPTTISVGKGTPAYTFRKVQ